MYTVYVIFNKECGKFYIGQTESLEERMRLHNGRMLKRCFTSRFKGMWEVVYTEIAATRGDALKREKQLKSFRGREFVKQHIPRWRSGSAGAC
ncbi:MAG: GIY-YIG nuclease family protein [Candidatus Paceibacterota bacterium]